MGTRGKTQDAVQTQGADSGAGEGVAAERFDLFVIGGGVNGCGIARDAAGRGLRVGLAEMGDLASGTSSGSTKLFHGGLRYLEYYEFRLVREALHEREVLLSICPHISRPMRFVLPHVRGMRPKWMLRAGLFIYDHLGGRSRLPGTRVIDLRKDPAGAPLRPDLVTAFEYSDGWVDDARLVVLNARDAAERGATVLTRTRVMHAEPADGGWRVTLREMDTGADREIWARALANAAGPWVADVLHGALSLTHKAAIRLVRGSHIVTAKLFDHDKAYFFQGADGRIIFAIPYEDDYTLIGTTEADHAADPGEAVCTPEEEAYLIRFANEYFRRPIDSSDVIWRYSGVRPLYDDGASSATAATRDYVLDLDGQAPAPVLHVFGGKITTYRRLAEQAVEKLSDALPKMGGAWTATAPLPGGAGMEMGGAIVLADDLQREFPELDPARALRLARSYGTDARLILAADPGRDFGAGLTGAEVAWMMRHEFARGVEDVIWRRSKLGLRMTEAQVARLAEWMAGEGATA